MNQKHFYSKLLAVALLLWLTNYSFAQTLSGEKNLLTPEREYTYTVTNPTAPTGYEYQNFTYSWEQWEGSILRHLGSITASAKIAWGNVPNDLYPQKVTCLVKWDEVLKSNGQRVPRSKILTVDVTVKYISRVSDIRVNSVFYGSTMNLQCGTAGLTLYVDPVTTQPSADVQYTWTLPSGWIGGGVYGATGNQIPVTPSVTGGGYITVVVKRVDDSYTITKTLRVIRPADVTPTFTSIPGKLCNSAKGIVTVTMPNASSYEWQVTNGLTINGATTATTTTGSIEITAPATGGTGGFPNARIIVRANTPCGLSAQSTASVAYGAANFSISGPSLLYQTGGSFSASGATAVSWYVLEPSQDPDLDYPSAFTVNYNGNFCTITPTRYARVGANYSIIARAADCGGYIQAAHVFRYVSRTDRGKNRRESFEAIVPETKVYPNPTSDLLTVEHNDELGNGVFSIELYDSYSRLTRTGKTKNGKIAIDTCSLPSGIYIVKIIQGNQVTSKQVVIQ